MKYAILEGRKKNQAGFGMIEVIVAAGALAVIVLAVGSMLSNGQRGVQSVQKRLAAAELQGFISQILNSNAICTSSLVGQPAPVAGAQVPTLKFGSVQIDETTTNNMFANGQIKVQSLKYKSVLPVGGLTAAVIELQVNLQGASASTAPAVVGGNMMTSVQFPLSVVTAAGLIVSCGSNGTRICNANGCFRVNADGTIEEWGRTSVTGGGGTAEVLPATFPYNFTSTTHLHVFLTPTGWPAGDGNPHPMHCQIQGYPTISGFNSIFSISVQITGSGYDHIVNGEYCDWYAIGD